MDVAGVIDEIGAGTATDFAIGDAVMAMVVNSASHGGYRESIVLSADSVVRAPAGATLIEAATLPMNGLTARQSLDQLALRPGQTLAVTGAAGCYGGYVVQLAKADALNVIADASSADEARSFVRRRYRRSRGNDIAEQIRRSQPHGVDGLADGSFKARSAVGSVRNGGRLCVRVRGWSGDERGIAFQNIGARLQPPRGFLDRLRQQSRMDSSRCASPRRSRRSRRRGASSPRGRGTRVRIVLGWRRIRIHLSR